MNLWCPRGKRDSFEFEEQGGFTSIREQMRRDEVSISYLRWEDYYY